MRRVLFCVIVALAACTHTGSSGPAWPKDRTRADGGESIAPRESSKAVAVALEQDSSDDDDAKPVDKPADKPAEKPAAATEAGAPAATPAAAEEPITTEEIVIEVGPDD